ncbi:MAG: hypothetical protein ACXVP8_10160 [Actinomycetota bacterium]
MKRALIGSVEASLVLVPIIALQPASADPACTLATPVPVLGGIL